MTREELLAKLELEAAQRVPEWQHRPPRFAPQLTPLDQARNRRALMAGDEEERATAVQR